MTRDQISSLAASAVTTTTTILSLYVNPIIEKSNSQEIIKLMLLVLGIPGFYVVYKMTYKVLSNIRYRHLLGVWYYSTKSLDDVDFKDSNFAKMRFYLNDDGELDYRVDIYKTEQSLLDNDVTQITGIANSDAIKYDHKKQFVKILYHVQYSYEKDKNPDRYGRLFLNYTDEGCLVGNWVSDLHQREISSGNMLAMRPPVFIKRLKNYKENSLALNT